MARVVVNTNVYISALVFGGVPQRVLELISSHSLPLYVSPSIMEEVSGTLAAKFGWTKEELELFLPPLWDRCIIITPTLRIKVCADPDDNHVLECAVAAEAEFLVTGTGAQDAAPKGVRSLDDLDFGGRNRLGVRTASVDRGARNGPARRGSGPSPWRAGWWRPSQGRKNWFRRRMRNGGSDGSIVRAVHRRNSLTPN